MKLKVSYMADKGRQELIERCMDATGIPTKQDLIDNALVVFDFAIEEKRAGRKIATVNDRDEVVHILRVPALDTVESESAPLRKTIDEVLLAELDPEIRDALQKIKMYDEEASRTLGAEGRPPKDALANLHLLGAVFMSYLDSLKTLSATELQVRPQPSRQGESPAYGLLTLAGAHGSSAYSEKVEDEVD